MKQRVLGWMILGLSLVAGCSQPYGYEPPIKVPASASLVYYSGGRSGFATTIPAPGDGLLYQYSERAHQVIGVQPVRRGENPQIELSAFTRVYFVQAQVGPSSQPAK